MENNYKSPQETGFTFGEKAVGLSFNPSDDQFVDDVKKLYASLLDVMDAARKGEVNPEKARMYSIAITDLQSSQMWAVKARTWKY